MGTAFNGRPGGAHSGSPAPSGQPDEEMGTAFNGRPGGAHSGSPFGTPMETDEEKGESLRGRPYGTPTWSELVERGGARPRKAGRPSTKNAAREGTHGQLTADLNSTLKLQKERNRLRKASDKAVERSVGSAGSRKRTASTPADMAATPRTAKRPRKEQGSHNLPELETNDPPAKPVEEMKQRTFAATRKRSLMHQQRLINRFYKRCRAAEKLLPRREEGSKSSAEEES
jgi:hypothetical protein